MNELPDGMKKYYAENTRSLEENLPELMEYLQPDTKVLDVGCGSGTITLGVAKAVKPGAVVGIDPVEFAIQIASRFAAERKVPNATFEVGDSYCLPFPDSAFDVVYSYTVLHYFNDPLRALREQMRVVKPGGWLVAAGVREWGMVRRYPPCPAWDKAVDARIRWIETHRERTHEGLDAAVGFGYTQAGSRCPGWFAELELKERRVEVQPCFVQYSGAERMEPFLMDLLPWEGQDEFGYHGGYKKDYEAMIREGFFDRQTLEQSIAEAAAWFADPHAFHFYVTVFVAGQR